MYNIINKIENVKSFLVINDITLIVSKDNNRLFFNDIFIDEYIDSYSYTYLKELVYVKELDSIIGKSKIDGFSYLRKSDNRINYSIIVMGDFDFLNDDIIATFKILNTLNLQVIDIDRLKNIIHSLNLENFLFLGSSNTIYTYTLPTATPLWQFDLGSLGEVVNDWGEKYPYEVEKFIGVLGSNLLVLLNQKELLALDIQTGKINQRLQYVDGLEGNSVLALDAKNKIKYYNTNYFVQEENNIVYALFEDVLFEINAAQPTITTTAYGVKNEYDKYQINPYKVSSKTFYYDQKIYFLEQELGRFGILDLPTRSIVYVSEPIAISGEGLGFDKLKEIQVAENKVYILDKTNTLLIFEKE